MHGSRVAVGTACAISCMVRPVPQVARAHLAARGDEQRDPHQHGQERASSVATISSDAADAPPLDPDRLAGRRELAERLQQSAAVGLHRCAQLRRARDAACRGERLRQLLGREVRERLLVDVLGARTQREHQHHVAEVDRLAPRRGPHLHEEHVDQAQPSVLHHQVRGLDVAVREPDVPHPADQLQPVVDDLVVDLGVADLDGVLEELHRDQVLALGRDLDDVERRRGREALLAEEPQGVVLVLDEAPDRAERRLVLQAAVEHRAPELVPAVGADVVAARRASRRSTASTPSSSTTRIFSGVEPPEPSRPTGFMLRTS